MRIFLVCIPICNIPNNKEVDPPKYSGLAKSTNVDTMDCLGSMRKGKFALPMVRNAINATN